MTPLRILHVTPYSEAAWGYGGIPRVVGALTRGLAVRGHRVTVATTDAADARSRLAGAPPTPGVDVRVFPNLSNALAYRFQLFLPRGLSAWLARHAGDFDVAHIHACHNLPAAAAARHLRRAGVPYVVAPHGTAPRLERRRAAKLLFDATVGRRLLPGAARAVAVSRAEARQLAALGVGRERTAVIPNPVEEPAEAPRPGRFRERFGLGEGPLVLYLGKLTPRKRVESLVEAFAALGRREARLVVAGNDMGSGTSVARRVRRLGLEARTVMTGLLRGAERFDALAAAGVTAYPSAHEVFGLVPLESLLCGTPVVVADDSGCGEIVAAVGGGRVVPLGDVEALAGAMAAALDDPETARREAAEAADRVRQSYGSEPVCRAWERLYEEVLRGVERGCG